MKRYVLGFAFNSDYTEVALIKKNRPDWQKGKYNGIGGKVEEGEPEILAMVREFKEETGIETLPEWWKPFTKMIFGEDILGGSAEVAVYKMSDSLITENVFTNTDEVVEVVPLKDLSELPTCPNVMLLVNLALQKEFNWVSLHQFI